MSDPLLPDVADLANDDWMAGMTAEERAREYEETLAAVREGLADAEAGRMIPLETLIEETRRQREDST